MFMKKLIYLFSLCLLLVSCGHKMQTQPSPASLVKSLGWGHLLHSRSRMVTHIRR